jgi:hypothetical protein
MLSENKNNLIRDFEKEIWLYLDNDLPESRMNFWNDNIESVPELLELLNETKRTLNIYDSNILSDVDDETFDSMLKKATAPATLLNKLKRLLPGPTSVSDGSDANIQKIAFGGFIVIAAMVIFMMTEKPNPVKTISSDVLDWDADVITTQLSDIQNSLFLAKDDKMREFILYKETSDDWSRSVYTIEQRLNQLKKETDDASL